MWLGHTQPEFRVQFELSWQGLQVHVSKGIHVMGMGVVGIGMGLRVPSHVACKHVHHFCSCAVPLVCPPEDAIRTVLEQRASACVCCPPHTHHFRAQLHCLAVVCTQKGGSRVVGG